MSAVMMLGGALPGFTALVPKVIVGVFLGLTALVGLFLIFFLIVCLWEKQYLVGDVEPAHEPWPYPPKPYWLKTREIALRVGLKHAGDYATRKHTSLVKGLETLFFTEDRTVLAAVVGAGKAGAKLNKTVLRTQLNTGRILESTDNPGSSDVTGVIDRAVLLNAGIEELLEFHLQRIHSSQTSVLPFRGAALEEHEHIDLERGKRMVLLKLACWVNPEETCIRLSWRGALAYLKQMFADMGKLQDQQYRTQIRRAG